MKTSKILIIAILSILLVSCGGSSKEDQRQNDLLDLQRRLQQQQQEQANQEQSSADSQDTKKLSDEEGPVTEQINSIYFALRATRINMDLVDQGKTVYMKCQSFGILDQINLCRIGFTSQEIELGQSYINQSNSSEIYQDIQSQAISNSMINGEVLAISCLEQCHISQDLNIGLDKKE